MKKMMKYSLLLAMGLSLVSCFDQPESSTTSGGGSGSTTSYGGTTDTGGSTNDNGGSTDTGGTTSGTTGTNNSNPPISWNVSYAFNVNWYPRNTAEWDARFCNHPNYNTYSQSECLAANNSLLSMTTPTVDTASVHFMTNSRYKVRITVKPMPVLTGTSNNSNLAGKLHCYRRRYPGVQGQAYSSLTFRTYLQKMNCSSTGNNCSLVSNGIQGQTYQERTVPVGSSTIIDYSPSFNRPASDYAYALRIENVTDENNHTRDFDCWEMKVELATDYTQDF